MAILNWEWMIDVCFTPESRRWRFYRNLLFSYLLPKRPVSFDMPFPAHRLSSGGITL